MVGRRVRTLAKLCLLTLPAFLVTALFLELVVFRSWVAVGDIPLEEYDPVSRIIHYSPGQHGTMFPDGDIHHPVPFAVNDDGWNSTHARYDKARNAKRRVAVIGDSYVAAFEVAPTESIAARLEGALGAERAEVYAFGVRGAPLSQYLHVARYVAATYAPDAIVIVIVHNDFDESYRSPAGRYTSAFLHVQVSPEAKVLAEVPPEPYRESALSIWARSRSALLRFLLYRSQVARQLVHTAYDGLFGVKVEYQANVDVAKLASEDGMMRAAARYVFDELVDLERSTKIKIVLVMDAPRAPMYERRDPRQAEAYQLNRIAAESAGAAGLSFTDLTDRFERDFRDHEERFEFPGDGHWNSRGHRIAAEAACEALRASKTYDQIECAK